MRAPRSKDPAKSFQVWILLRPGFALAAILSLALGIGVTTAIFSVLNAVAPRPLPFSDPDRLVWMTQLLHGSNTDEVTTALVCAFAALAAILGIIGVYGVVSCRVRWQIRELAVRLALGAQPQDLIRQVLSQGLVLIAAGIVAGVAGSLALGRLLSGMPYEVRANDPLTLVGAGLLLVVVTLAACWIPARRAARVDPLALLRYE